MTTYQTLDFALDLPGQCEDPDLLAEALVVQRIEDDGGASSLSDYAETLMRRFVRGHVALGRH